jgi:hypothetical protein
MEYKRYLDSMSKEKTTYEKELICMFIDEPPVWKDIKHIELEDDDMIQMSWDEHDDCYCVRVVRWIEETDEEYQERLQYMSESENRAKERRRQHYLKLKAEFENEG